MKNFKRIFSAILVIALMMSLASCALIDKLLGKTPEQPAGVDGTYTAKVKGDLGENTFTLILSNGKDVQMNISAGPINDSYFGTYVVNGDKVEITHLYNENNPNSKTPGLWNDIIDAESGDCVVVLGTDGTFTFEPTGNESALPDLPDGPAVGDNVYTFILEGMIGTDTFTLTVNDDGTVELQIANAMFTDVFTGTYTQSGNELSIKGLVGDTAMGSGVHPSLFGDIINAETGDCDVVLNDADKSFTFKPTGAEGGLPDGPIGPGGPDGPDGPDEGDNVYTFVLEGAIGTDTFTLTVNGDGTVEMKIANAMFTDVFTGTYTQNGNELSIKGLVGNTMMGENVHPGLFADIINAETGDCDVVLGEDGSFTFKPTGAEGGIPGGGFPGIGGDEEEWTGGTTYADVAYGEGESQTMDVYVPTEGESLPLFVMIHGGAFKFGSADMMSDVYGYFRDKGFVCASLNYTLGEGTYPQAVIDCKSAVQYLVDNASTYKINADQIIVIGESAGSTIGSLVALSGASDFKAEGASDYTFKVNTYIDFYGPISNGDANIGENIDGGVNAWLGDAAAPNLASYFTGMFSCKNIWIQHGDADTSVNKAHAELFKAAIDNYNAGVTIPPAKIGNVHYEILAGADHMDEAFYTDDNLNAIYEWLCDIYGITTAELVATYSHTATSTNPMTGAEMTDVFELKLYSDGSCSIGIPAGNDMVKGPFFGTYTLEGTTLTVSGLSGVPGVGYTFVADGGFIATLDDTAKTFTPAV